MINVSVIEIDYTGLVDGTCLSDFGMNVICVDKDESKIDMLNESKLPIYEICLNELIRRNVKLKLLH